MNNLGKMLEEYFDRNLEYKTIRYQPDNKAVMMSGAERMSEFNSNRFKQDMVDIIFKSGQS